MINRKFIAVFSGSKFGNRPEFRQSAEELGREAAGRGYGISYGGSRLGLMGVVAESNQKNGGFVRGVITEDLRHLAKGEDELIVAPDWTSRINQIIEPASGIVALPGGLGSLFEKALVLQDKLFELNPRPFVVLNTQNFYSGFLAHIESMINGGFVEANCRGFFYIASAPREALDYIESRQPKK